MVELAELARATPGTVSEIAARLGTTEREVRRVIQGIRDRSPARRQDIKIIGRRGRQSIYKIGPPPPKPPQAGATTVVDVADLAAVSPGTVRELAERLGVSELVVRKRIETARSGRTRVEIIGKRDGRNIYKVGAPPPPRASEKKQRRRFNIREAALATRLQLFSLPVAAEATVKQAREIAAERVHRNCMRCDTRFQSTRHGPRYCDPCRRYITSFQ